MNSAIDNELRFIKPPRILISSRNEGGALLEEATGIVVPVKPFAFDLANPINRIVSYYDTELRSRLVLGFEDLFLMRKRKGSVDAAARFLPSHNSFWRYWLPATHDHKIQDEAHETAHSHYVQIIKAAEAQDLGNRYNKNLENEEALCLWLGAETLMHHRNIPQEKRYGMHLTISNKVGRFSSNYMDVILSLDTTRKQGFSLAEAINSFIVSPPKV